MAKKILIVDDEPEMLILLTSRLEANNYDVINAKDGDTCLKMVASEKPDLIVLDLMLPGISGIEVCKRLKEDDTTKNIPIIILTAAGTQMKSIGLEKGAAYYLMKPFDADQLLSKIKSALKVKAAKK